MSDEELTPGIEWPAALIEGFRIGLERTAADIHGIQPQIREAVRKALAGGEVTPYDLTAEPKARVLVQPGWGDRLKELAPRAEEDHG